MTTALALNRGDTLTPTEERIMRALCHYGVGHYVEAGELLLAGWPECVDYIDDEEQRRLLEHALRVNISRLRPKAEAGGYRIENRAPHGLYRLVRVEGA